ncbi:hypothetical protein E0L36_23180 [Streptomyces sp. AJS327]|uniref:hypothetical protein n=1 Tax=Streptomyces sp. AJS327 TaxID=2545265 RepID=UPI0015E048A5|nr:hypothetical protein [Streptomyces sp. AJS327]MBA0053663.1 hypothetical protein [Streptomyces sp. AJS327]
MIKVAKAFTRAYVTVDARDGRDSSYSATGHRAKRHSTEPLTSALTEERPGQRKSWAALRVREAVISAVPTRVCVPDGAPEPSDDTALVRVFYHRTEKGKGHPTRRTEEQLTLALTRTTRDAWRVHDLPWA